MKPGKLLCCMFLLAFLALTVKHPIEKFPFIYSTIECGLLNSLNPGVSVVCLV